MKILRNRACGMEHHKNITEMLNKYIFFDFRKTHGIMIRGIVSKDHTEEKI